MYRFTLVFVCCILLMVSCGEGEDPIAPSNGKPTAGNPPGQNNDSTEDEDPTGEETESPTTESGLEIYEKIYGATDIYSEGDYVIIKTKGRPDHKSPYYEDTNWEGDLYEAYNGSNSKFKINPNRIGEFNYTFKIPLNPKLDSKHEATPLGAIGVSLNGIPFYNQYAGPDQPLTDEVDSFDQYNGHPTGNSNYHYHVEPLYLTENQGKDVLIGFLLDGFPVYGPEEDGDLVSKDDLDNYHGHTHATSDYPDGIYHYHITSDDPYINGSGFYGTPGTFAQ